MARDWQERPDIEPYFHNRWHLMKVESARREECHLLSKGEEAGEERDKLQVVLGQVGGQHREVEEVEDE